MDAKIQHTEVKTDPVIKSLPGNAGRSMPRLLQETADAATESLDKEILPDDISIFLFSQAGE